MASPLLEKLEKDKDFPPKGKDMVVVGKNKMLRRRSHPNTKTHKVIFEATIYDDAIRYEMNGAALYALKKISDEEIESYSNCRGRINKIKEFLVREIPVVKKGMVRVSTDHTWTRADILIDNKLKISPDNEPMSLLRQTRHREDEIESLEDIEPYKRSVTEVTYPRMFSSNKG